MAVSLQGIWGPKKGFCLGPGACRLHGLKLSPDPSLAPSVKCYTGQRLKQEQKHAEADMTGDPVVLLPCFSEIGLFSPPQKKENPAMRSRAI